MSSITWNMEMSLSACPVCTSASDNEQLPVTTSIDGLLDLSHRCWTGTFG